MSYRVTVVNDGDEVLAEIDIDGFDLRKQPDRVYLAERIQSEMGTRAVEECASRPEAPDEDDSYEGQYKGTDDNDWQDR